MSHEATLALLLGLIFWGVLIVFAVRRYGPSLGEGVRNLNGWIRRRQPTPRTTDEFYSEIDMMMVAGYASEEELLSYAEELAPDYGADLVEARSYVERTVSQRTSEEAGWPETTVNDRITRRLVGRRHRSPKWPACW